MTPARWRRHETPPLRAGGRERDGPMACDVLLCSSDRMLEHDPGPGHPERPDRLSAVLETLRGRPVPGTRWVEPEPAPLDPIRRVHDPDYVALIAATKGRSLQLDPDTATCAGSVDAALLAAGGALHVVTEVCSRRAERGFALVRPPGHHAERARAMGFCLFNNVAIAAEHAVRELGRERVLIVDWDVHHGNGTQHTFEERSDVLVFNTHQHPLYPGTGVLDETGRGSGEGFTVNVPLPAGCGDADLLAIYEELLLPVAESYEPDLVLVSAGFDAHEADPLAGLSLTEGGFAALCDVAADIADAHAGGRLALLLEGGYDLASLSESVREVVAILAGGSAPDRLGSMSRGGRAALEAALGRHGERWGLR